MFPPVNKQFNLYRNSQFHIPKATFVLVFLGRSALLSIRLFS
jgi:hypothetical protein